MVVAWGGLRGGISVAMALSLPADYSRSLVLTLIYFVVVFSISYTVEGPECSRVRLVSALAKARYGTVAVGPSHPVIGCKEGQTT